jgi:hypothetical protein
MCTADGWIGWTYNKEPPTPGLSATRKLNSCGSVLACDSVLRHSSWKSWPNKKPNIEDTGGERECREVARGGGKWKETQVLGVLRRGARVAAVAALDESK